MSRYPPRTYQMVALLAFAACTGKDDDTSSGDSDSAVVSDAFTSVEVVFSEVIGTVPHVTWTTTGITDGWTEWKAAGGDWTRINAANDGDAHDAVILGMKAGTAYSVRAGGTLDGAEVVSDPVDVTTVGLPGALPDVNTNVNEPESSGGYMTAGMLSGQAYAAIFDGDGAYVWWYANPDVGNATARVIRSNDGRTVLFNSFPAASDSADFGTIYRVSFDGTELESYELAGLHHDFCELPDGTLAYLSNEPRQVGSVNINGDLLIERAPDGTERQVWSVWDNYTYDPDSPVAGDADFLHANVVKYDERTDEYWVGLRNISALVRIDRATGEQLAQIGGEDSTYALGSGDPTSGQHSFSLTDDGFVVLDNRLSVSETSRIVDFALDDTAFTMNQTAEYVNPLEYHEIGLGDAVRLPNGNTRIVWSSSGELGEVTPEGAYVWKVNLDVGTGFGYGTWSDDAQVMP